VHEGGGSRVGSNKLVELKKKKKEMGHLVTVNAEVFVDDQAGTMAFFLV